MRRASGHALRVPRALWMTVIATCGLLTGCNEDTTRRDGPPASAAPGGERLLRGSVVRVVDGDTIRVRTAGGPTERVRLLGIDAPELSETRTGTAQCGGAEAFAELATLLPRGASVTLEPDPTQDRRDRFGRLLAYVRTSDAAGTLQERLLRDGWARVYVYDRARPFGEVVRFRSAAALARRDQVGVWDECGGDFRRPLRP